MKIPADIHDSTGAAGAPPIAPSHANQPAVRTGREETSQWCTERAAADRLSATNMDTDNGRLRFERSAIAWDELAHLKQVMEDKRETDRWPDET